MKGLKADKVIIDELLSACPVDYNGFTCQYCDRPFDPIKTRYLCPYPDCKMKNTCCEG